MSAMAVAFACSAVAAAAYFVAPGAGVFLFLAGIVVAVVVADRAEERERREAVEAKRDRLRDAARRSR